MRHLAYDRARHQRRYPDVCLDDLDVPDPDTDPAVQLDGQPDPGVLDATRRAFASLLPRWRAALWLSAVEGRTPAELATRWGSTPNTVAALTCRARRAFRQAYTAVPSH